MASEETLLDCPFCGSQDIRISSYDVECHGCGATVSGGDEALDRWNSRAAIAALQQESPRAAITDAMVKAAREAFNTEADRVRLPHIDRLLELPPGDLDRAVIEARADEVGMRAALEAALAQPLHQPAPEAGWKLVPVEPTSEMLTAAFECDQAPSAEWSRYKAMLDAAPAPEPQAPCPECAGTGYRDKGGARLAIQRVPCSRGCLPPEPQAPVPDGVREITDRMIAAAILAAVHHNSRTFISTDAMTAALSAALTAANERSR